MLQTILIRGLLGIAMFGAVLAQAHAFQDDKQQIARQWQAHDQAITSAMRAFSSGNTKGQLDAVTTIATSEAYLAILGVPTDDPRLIAWLFDGNHHMPEKISRLFHHLLKEKTGFEPSLSTILRNPRRYGFSNY